MTFPLVATHHTTHHSRRVLVAQIDEKLAVALVLLFGSAPQEVPLAEIQIDVERRKRRRGIRRQESMR